MNTESQPPNHDTVGSLPLRDGVRAGGLLLLAYLALRLAAPYVAFLPLPIATPRATLPSLVLPPSPVARGPGSDGRGSASGSGPRSSPRARSASGIVRVEERSSIWSSPGR